MTNAAMAALHLGSAGSFRGYSLGTHRPVNRFFAIQLSEIPEGGWAATSFDIPGLFIEGDTLEEAREEALLWGRELVRDNLGHDPSRNTVFVFNDGKERSYSRP